jgi:hypothetical protein
MHTGFTGTQRGMTAIQRNIARGFLSQGWFPEDAFHHGDCIGSDAECAYIAKDIGYWVVGHPPTNSSKRAFFQSDAIHTPRTYLVRNHNIVDCSAQILAMPGEMNEVLRSGTWATIRYAIKKRKKICIIYPDGTSEVR